MTDLHDQINENPQDDLETRPIEHEVDPLNPTAPADPTGTTGSADSTGASDDVTTAADNFTDPIDSDADSTDTNDEIDETEEIDEIDEANDISVADGISYSNDDTSDDTIEADDTEAPYDTDIDDENAFANTDNMEVEEIDVVISESDADETTIADIDEENPVLSDEELDQVADTAINILQDFLKYFNVGEVTIDEYEGEEGELILDITGSDLAVLIGRHGKTLDALQFLVSAITVRKIGFRYPIVVDVEGYKGRQRQKLESIARSAANRAANQNRSIKLRPMTPYERRIVHITLRDDSRVETASEGEGSTRHVVVLPI